MIKFEKRSATTLDGTTRIRLEVGIVGEYLAVLEFDEIPIDKSRLAAIMYQFANQLSDNKYLKDKEYDLETIRDLLKNG